MTEEQLDSAYFSTLNMGEILNMFASCKMVSFMTEYLIKEGKIDIETGLEVLDYTASDHDNIYNIMMSLFKFCDNRAMESQMTDYVRKQIEKNILEIYQ